MERRLRRSTCSSHAATTSPRGMTRASCDAAPVRPVNRKSSAGPSRFTYAEVETASTSMQASAAAKRHR